jgi:hypothetical protein
MGGVMQGEPFAVALLGSLIGSVLGVLGLAVGLAVLYARGKRG